MTPDQLRKRIEKATRGAVAGKDQEQRDADWLALTVVLVHTYAPLFLELWEAAGVLHKARHAWCNASCPTLKALTALEEA